MQRFDVPNYGFIWLHLSRAGSTRGAVQLEIWPFVRFGVRIAVFDILFIYYCLQPRADRNSRSSIRLDVDCPTKATRDVRVRRTLPAGSPRISFTSETEIRTGAIACPNFLANISKFALHHYVRLVTSVVRPEALLDRRK
jgi:hypothetical protein